MRRRPDDGARQAVLASTSASIVGALLRRDVGDDEVLVGGEAEVAVVDLGDLAQRR